MMVREGDGDSPRNSGPLSPPMSMGDLIAWKDPREQNRQLLAQMEERMMLGV